MVLPRPWLRGRLHYALRLHEIATDYDKLETIVELKYSKADASDADLAAKAEDGIRKLRQYAADPSVPTLAKDTRLHLILYQFKGTELIRLEEVTT